MTDRSLYLLCLCARQTGASSYSQVGRMAFGKRMEWFISILLFVFLIFVLIAYMVLARDIWTPIVGLVVTNPDGDVILLIILILLSPFLVQKSLHSLRFNSYIGFAAVSILCIALCHHAWIGFPPKTENVMLPKSVGDVLFVFPIIVLSFLCQFNIIPIQVALMEPTRKRMNGVINGSVGASFLLMCLFGLGGYLYAGNNTQGNILLNCDLHNPMFLLGRFGCGVTIVLAKPMMLLPCRNNLLEILDLIVTSQSGETISLIRNEPQQRQLLSNIPWVHYSSTFLIILICYIGAIKAIGVAVVWSMCGSSMAFIIGFILPSACYLQIQRKNERTDNTPW
eukprot:CAMPEP_0118684980 /NCGR_PEP_ID=MMETSP0800-20121206/6967_1 /TAXON_ID=210618 ORGANISM="Striatella unipunctata, Strain CCMP2910" /NCGR_SAMPLE_ID=MMETSP0800 /ASSEMBLY_ACC=CAM_ASM_000638 /LENGTH=337 /DNA_ID=CAMNT_0006581791 /DNA_START=73 /DNA_END=1083 /DNA_ORIENTATION=-